MVSAQLSTDLLAHAREASWVVLIDVVDLDLIEAVIGCPGDALVVLSDDSKIDFVEAHWPLAPPERLQITRLLLGSESCDVPWFHFNDPRHDGVYPLEDLQDRFPNLRLESTEIRKQLTLAQLLQRWEPAEFGGGMLLIGAGSASELLSQSDVIHSFSVLGIDVRRSQSDDHGLDPEIEQLNSILQDNGLMCQQALAPDADWLL